jgi:hypothetical protein
MNLSALPLVLDGQGRVKMWRMPVNRSAPAKRRERQAGPLSLITRSTRMPCRRYRRRARRRKAVVVS